jgi:hypothetical protein
MWWVYFAVTWAAFMVLLVLTIVQEERKDAILRAQINTTLTDTLALYPDGPERVPRQSCGGAQPVSSTGVETEKVLSAG